MDAKLKYLVPNHYSNDEREIWQVLIFNDFVAFCNQDWDLITNDFLADGFFGVDGHGSNNKLDWSLVYPNLDSYKKTWIEQSLEFGKNEFLVDPLDVLFRTTELSKIEIISDTALVHKTFSGQFDVKNQPPIILDWLSIFLLRKVDEKWKISSFTGYLPK